MKTQKSDFWDIVPDAIREILQVEILKGQLATKFTVPKD